MLDNKRIVKNTIILYIRMLFLMCISLYTSRVILHALGISDFGIYNIVGSVVVLFSFLNNALTSTTRRFLNFHIGKGDYSELQRIFASLLTVHLIVGILIVILGETIGLWFMNTQLNIPEERMEAANVVYQMSILTTFLGVALSPYEGVIVAEERMSIYAWLSLFDALFKLGLVLTLIYTPFDRLITYAVFLTLISIFILLCKIIYCYKYFSYSWYHLYLNKEYTKPLLSFSGWSLFGQVAYIGATTGVNMVVNVFWGVLVNAAVGIAQQINSTIYNFVANFQTAFNPQLVKTYAVGNHEEHTRLLSRATRISYYLLFVLVVPVFFNIDYILHLWLIEVPVYATSFTIIIIASSLIEATGAPLWMSMQAIGNIKYYQMIVSSINMMNIPLSYILLKMGCPPISVFVGQLSIGTILYVFRLFYILPKLNIRVQDYLKKILLPILIISGVVFFFVALSVMAISQDYLRLLLSIVITMILSGVLIYQFGLTTHEKKYIENNIKKFAVR